MVQGPSPYFLTSIVTVPTKAITTGITRFDIPERNTHGCLMRICRQGKRIQEFFSDSTYGGKRKSRDAAIARYEELNAQLPARGSTKDQITKRNASGKVGVYEAITQDVAGNEHRSYCAAWTDDDGTRRKLNFSCKKHGDKLAWELACFTRSNRIHDRDQVMKAFQKDRKFSAPRRKK